MLQDRKKNSVSTANTYGHVGCVEISSTDVAFHRDFTVWENTCLGVSSLQSLKKHCLEECYILKVSEKLPVKHIHCT